MSIPRLSRRDSAPDLLQSETIMSSIEDLDIIDSIIEKAVNAIGTLEDKLSRANEEIAIQQRDLYERGRKDAKCGCSDRIVELEHQSKSERQAYAELRKTANSLQRRVEDLTRKLRDKRKQQKDAEYAWDGEKQKLLKQIDEAQRPERTGNQMENESLREECAKLRKMNNTNREVVKYLRERLEQLLPELVEK